MASSDAGLLRLFHPETASLFRAATPWLTASKCNTILAMAGAQVRIACVDDVESVVYLYTRDSASGKLDSVRLAGSDELVSGTWKSSRRLFSPSGNWLVLTTPERLHFGDVSAASPAVAWSSPFSGSRSAPDMSFSPDESLLAVQAEADLYLYQPSALGRVAAHIALLGDGGRPPQCQERLLAPPSWCGSDQLAHRFVWSPNSYHVAFVTSTGALRVQNLRIRPISFIPDAPDVATSCTSYCSTGFQFQP